MNKLDKVVKSLEEEGYVVFIGRYLGMDNVRKIRTQNGIDKKGVVLGIDMLKGKDYRLDFECDEYPELTAKQYIRNTIYEYEYYCRQGKLDEAMYFSSLGTVRITENEKKMTSSFELKEVADDYLMSLKKEKENE